MSASDWSFADAFGSACSRHAERTAWLQGNDRITYAELWNDVERLATVIMGQTAEGARFGILAKNSHRYLAAFGAAALSRRVIVPLNGRLTAAEQTHILSDSDCRLLFADDTNLEPAVGLAQQAGIEVVSLDRLAGSPTSGDEPAEGDLAALMYTAAVDGEARGAMMTQRSFSFQMANMAEALCLSPSDRVAIFTPLCHAAAVTYALATLHAGATCVCLTDFDGQLAASAIDEHRVTVLPAFAPMPRLILDAAEESGTNLSSLKTIIARDSVATMRAFFELTASLEWRVGNFGQTETQGMAVVGTPVKQPDLANEAWSPPGGRPMPLTRVRVVDAHDGDVPRGQIGEIIVKGPNTAVGYWQRDRESQAALRGGWWHTGDLGRFDETGALHFAGMDRREGPDQDWWRKRVPRRSRGSPAPSSSSAGRGRNRDLRSGLDGVSKGGSRAGAGGGSHRRRVDPLLPVFDRELQEASSDRIRRRSANYD